MTYPFKGIPDSQRPFSRHQEAIHVVAALGDPEAHFLDSPHGEWGEVANDYTKKTTLGADSLDETIDYYMHSLPEDLTIVEIDP